jgi:hypothetical protein
MTAYLEFNPPASRIALSRLLLVVNLKFLNCNLRPGLFRYSGVWFSVLVVLVVLLVKIP